MSAIGWLGVAFALELAARALDLAVDARQLLGRPRQQLLGYAAVVEQVADSADEAVTRANATTYGLSAGILTSDADRGFALAQQVDAGIVHVNDQPVGDEPQMPFGGVKDSGWGRFGGQAVIEEFTELRWITVTSGSHPFPF